MKIKSENDAEKNSPRGRKALKGRSASEAAKDKEMGSRRSNTQSPSSPKKDRDEEKSGSEGSPRSRQSKLPTTFSPLREKRGEFAPPKRAARKSVDSWVAGSSLVTTPNGNNSVFSSNLRKSGTPRTPKLGTLRAGDVPDPRRGTYVGLQKPAAEYTIDELCSMAWDGKDIPTFREIVSGYPKEKINDYNSRGQTALYCAARYVYLV